MWKCPDTFLPGGVQYLSVRGDRFSGVFLRNLHGYGAERETRNLLSGKALCDCLPFSNQFCALSVQKNGAIASYPTADEMNHIIIVLLKG